ncbi:MAG: hypothetical protein ACK5DL_03815 [Burkholderiales bacterium]|jgi:hypothetical protein|nr:hypothetical protein [Betaproteobacteria bacterium]
MKNSLANRSAAVIVAITLLPTTALSQATRSGGAGGDVIATCLKGAGIGSAAAIGLNLLNKVVGIASGSNTDSRKQLQDLGKTLLVGCTVSLAVTAIGKILNQSQQDKYEEAMQRDAARRAEEARKFGEESRRITAAPASSPEQIANRDVALEKLRLDYEASARAPVSVDLGGGGTAIITGNPLPTQPATGANCQERSSYASTSAGQARQFETWCQDGQGTWVRSEVRAA